jgi:hypothetical protein
MLGRRRNKRKPPMLAKKKKTPCQACEWRRALSTLVGVFQKCTCLTIHPDWTGRPQVPPPWILPGCS